MRAGADAVVANDIDPFAVAAIPLNARANGVRLDVTRRDLLDEGPPPDIDVILAADTWYDSALARRVPAVAAAGPGRGHRRARR